VGRVRWLGPSGIVLEGKFYLVDLGQHSHLRSVQNPERQVHHLKVFAARGSADTAWLGADIVQDSLATMSVATETDCCCAFVSRTL